MGESSKALAADRDVLCRTHIGGQALIEGIMMRGRYNWAVAIREPDGSIYTEEHDLASGRKKNRWMYLLIIRGCVAFVESLALGYKALNISSEHAYDWEEEEEEGKEGTAVEAQSASDSASEPEPHSATKSADDEEEGSSGLGALMTVSMIVGLLLGIVIFILAPAALTNLILGGDQQMNGIAWNIIDGLLRVVIFVAYIWLISLMKDIRRMFGYHGAEHKTIHCFEHGLPMTPANAQSFPTLHVRCGTAFMIMVMVIAIFVYTVLGSPINLLIDQTGIMEGPLRFAMVILTRIILMPLIAGLSYEITVKWAGQRPDNPVVKVILWPGMQMQRLTTNPPDDSMIECAIAAMNLVLAREELEETKAEEIERIDNAECVAA